MEQNNGVMPASRLPTEVIREASRRTSHDGSFGPHRTMAFHGFFKNQDFHPRNSIPSVAIVVSVLVMVASFSSKEAEPQNSSALVFSMRRQEEPLDNQGGQMMLLVKAGGKYAAKCHNNPSENCHVPGSEWRCRSKNRERGR